MTDAREDFPAPLGPTNAWILFLLKLADMLFRILSPSIDRLRFLISKMPKVPLNGVNF